ncbi:heterokaryon incompatibility protein-domain-containing protein [Hypoxylon rubiginosum]|uniref:Heterokaryon incompatibility protein-domain-containing protein n=1 Tax=Hypoxylon rubiginosum TaxID=110542 RepID=A0ACB9Z5D3_9PEZI|nr:heterokaryon incompatibility protein-domain-containing protein [Hypoxylon rubiginosum]
MSTQADLTEDCLSSGSRGSSSRWHEPSCTDPDIVVEGSIPFCKACHSKPSLEDIISQHELSNMSTAQPPPDEPPHDMKLRWPESVPYVNQAPSEDAESPSIKPLRHIGDAEHYEQDVTESIIYPSALAPDEFRLLCISIAPDKESPIHATLETYSDDNYPEYETVSYTWGGEDGDNHLCRPIFIGPYWDVLPQTENCWQLLRFVRPTRGVRLIWIDAVCINQRNFEERAAQVAKMAQIYRQCTKVVIYLGPHIAPILDSRFPLRRGLHTMDAASLEIVLRQRYFTRIWVIQELISSPRAVIRIGQTDFYVDSAMQDNFSEWKKTTTPWLQYAARQRLQVADSYEALAIISRSQSADPRDRLFGILGLLPGNKYSSQLRPNYSLSIQHLWIGFFAHCLLRENNPWFLFHATGVHHQSSIPSWVPQWNSMVTWDYLPPPDPDDKYIFNSRYNQLGKVVAIHSTPNKNLWNHRASVCSRTGTLCNLLLEHLFILPRAPVRIHDGSNSAYHVFQVDQSEGPRLYLVSKSPLDILVRPMCDRLFLFQGRKDIVVFLVLRGNMHLDSGQRTIPLPNKKQYHLVATCLYVSFGILKITNSREIVQMPLNSLTKGETAHSVIENCRDKLDGLIQMGTLHAVFARGILFKETLKGTVVSNNFLVYWILLPLFATCIKSDHWTHDWEVAFISLFKELYLSYFDPKYEPKVDGGYFQISIPPSMWPLMVRNIQDYKERCNPGAKTTEAKLVFWEQKLGHGEWQHLVGIDETELLETFKGPEPQTVSFRTDIFDVFESQPVFQNVIETVRLLRWLSAIPEIFTLKELIDAIRHPREEYKYILPQGEYGDFAVDGRSYYVDIL